MLTEHSSGLTKFVTSLKVAALASVLGAVVLAAEHRFDMQLAPDQTGAGVAAASADSKADRGAQQAPADYFPAHFPTPSGPVSEQPPTF
jgi:hypothetical protein